MLKIASLPCHVKIIPAIKTHKEYEPLQNLKICLIFVNLQSGTSTKKFKDNYSAKICQHLRLNQWNYYH